MTDEQELSNKWHLDKRIHIGHLVTTITVATASVLYVSKLEQRIALVESHVALQRERDERQDRSLEAAANQITSRLERIDAKLDRLIEKNQR